MRDGILLPEDEDVTAAELHALHDDVVAAALDNICAEDGPVEDEPYEDEEFVEIGLIGRRAAARRLQADADAHGDWKQCDIRELSRH